LDLAAGARVFGFPCLPGAADFRVEAGFTWGAAWATDRSRPQIALKPAAMNCGMRALIEVMSDDLQAPEERLSMRPVSAIVMVSAPEKK
jgi:hypothetical protein